MADDLTPIQSPAQPEMNGIQAEIAREMGGSIPQARIPAGLAPSSGSSYEVVGNTVYKRVLGPDGQPLYQGPDGNSYDQATLDQRKADQEKYGGLLGEAGATALGGLRGVSFGLSDVAGRVLGGKNYADLAKKLEEINPNLSMGSELAGAIAPALLSGGTSVAAEGGALAARTAVTGLTEAVQGAGRIAENLVARGLEDVSAKTLAGQVLKSAVTHGVGSAVEGAFYGGGQVVSDLALGDPEMNAEKAISTIGLSALLGGTTGGSFSALREVAPSLLEKGKVAASKLSDLLEKASDKTSSTIASTIEKVTGQPSEIIEPLIQFNAEGRALRAQAVAPKAVQEENKKELVKAVSDLLDNGNETVHELNKAKDVETSALFEHSPVAPEVAKGAADDLATRMKAQLNQMRGEPEIYSATGKIKQFENVFDGFQKGVTEAKTAPEVFKLINETKQDLDPILEWDKSVSPQWKESIDQLTKIRADFKNTLTNPEIFGDAAAAHADVNDVLSKYYGTMNRFEKEFGRMKPQISGRPQMEVDPQKFSRYLNDPIAARAEGKDQILHEMLGVHQDVHALIDRMASGPYEVSDLISHSPTLSTARTTSNALKEEVETKLKGQKAVATLKHIGHSNLVSTGELLGAGAAHAAFGLPGLAIASAANYIKHPANLIKSFAMMERAFGNTSKVLGHAVDQFVDKAPTLGRAILPAAVKTLDMTKFGPGKEADSKASAYNQRLSELSTFVSNPDKAASILQNSTAAMERVAPNIAQAMQTKVSMTLQYLHQTAPKDPLAGQRMLPTKSQWQPSDRDLNKWQRRVEIAENPLNILPHLKNGSVTRDQIETLQATAPKIYQELSTKMIEKVTNSEKTLPYQKHLQLGILLGTPLDPSMQPAFIQSMQQNHQEVGIQAQQSQGQAKPKGHMSQLKLPSNQQTNMERIQSR